MTRTITLTKFRAAMSDILKTNVAGNKQHIVIENNGVPLAVVIGIDDYEDFLDAHDPVVQARIEASAAEARTGKIRPVHKLFREFHSAAAKGRRISSRTRG